MTANGALRVLRGRTSTSSCVGATDVFGGVSHEADRQSRWSGHRIAHGGRSRSAAATSAQAGGRAVAGARRAVPDDVGRRHEGRGRAEGGKLLAGRGGAGS